MDIKQQIAAWTGGKFPRALGFPYRSSYGKYFIVNSVEEIEQYIKERGDIDIYCTMYSFEKYTQSERDPDSCVVDAIFFDLDCDDLWVAFKDCKKLADWATRHGAFPIVNFSGGKGFHISIPIVPVKLLNPRASLRAFMKELNDVAQLTTVDPVVTGDINRILRLSGTRHSKSGLYCTPLNPAILPYISVKDIVKMAENPPTYVPERVATFGEIREYLIEIDKRLVASKIEHRESLTSSALGNILTAKRPNVMCPVIVNILKVGCTMGQFDTAICGIIHYYRDKMSEAEVLDELHKFNDVCKGQITEAHILDKLRYHYDKSYHPCTFFSMISQTCDTCHKMK